MPTVPVRFDAFASPEAVLFFRRYRLLVRQIHDGKVTELLDVLSQLEDMERRLAGSSGPLGQLLNGPLMREGLADADSDRPGEGGGGQRPRA